MGPSVGVWSPVLPGLLPSVTVPVSGLRRAAPQLQHHAVCPAASRLVNR